MADAGLGGLEVGGHEFVFGYGPAGVEQRPLLTFSPFDLDELERDVVGDSFAGGSK